MTVLQGTTLHDCESSAGEEDEKEEEKEEERGGGLGWGGGGLVMMENPLGPLLIHQVRLQESRTPHLRLHSFD